MSQFTQAVAASQLRHVILKQVAKTEPVDTEVLLLNVHLAQSKDDEHWCTVEAFTYGLMSLETDGLVGISEFRSVLTDKGRDYLKNLGEMIS